MVLEDNSIPLQMQTSSRLIAPTMPDVASMLEQDSICSRSIATDLANIFFSVSILKKELATVCFHMEWIMTLMLSFAANHKVVEMWTS